MSTSYDRLCNLMSSQAHTTPNQRSVSQVTRNKREVRPLILIVEDHEDTRFLLSFVMEQCGFRVIQALDGVEAVHAAEKTRPDLILMDTNLPRVDGLMATRAIRNGLHDVPIVFISGHAEPEARAAAIATGGNEYFVKPINLKELEIVVKKQLADNNRLGVELLPIFYQEYVAS